MGITSPEPALEEWNKWKHGDVTFKLLTDSAGVSAFYRLFREKKIRLNKNVLLGNGMKLHLLKMMFYYSSDVLSNLAAFEHLDGKNSRHSTLLSKTLSALSSP